MISFQPIANIRQRFNLSLFRGLWLKNGQGRGKVMEIIKFKVITTMLDDKMQDSAENILKMLCLAW